MRTFAVFFLTVTLFLATPIRAWKCPAKGATVEDELNASTHVFVGELIHCRPDRNFRGYLTFRVETIWRGFPRETISVSQSRGRCGYYELGSRYQVYAQGPPEDLSFKICSRTKRLGFLRGADSLDDLAPPLRFYDSEGLLGKPRPLAAVPTAELIERLRSNRLADRIQALHGLAQRPVSVSTPRAIFGHVRSESSEERRFALAALHAFGAAAAPVAGDLASLLPRLGGTERDTAIEILRAIGPDARDAGPELLRLVVGERRPETVLRAAEALASTNPGRSDFGREIEEALLAGRARPEAAAALRGLEIHPSRAIEHFTEQLERRVSLRRTIETLRYLEAREAVPELIALLDEHAHWRQAGFALGTVVGPEVQPAIPKLVERLRYSSEGELEVEVLAGLAAAPGVADATAEVLIATVSDKWYRHEKAANIGRSELAESVFDALERRLASGDASSRLKIFKTLNALAEEGRWTSSPLPARLRRLARDFSVHDPDVDVRVVALGAYASFGDAEVVEHLGAALLDENLKIRRSAFDLLSWLSNLGWKNQWGFLDSGVEELTGFDEAMSPALRDPDEELRRDARQAFGFDRPWRTARERAEAEDLEDRVALNLALLTVLGSFLAYLLLRDRSD